MRNCLCDILKLSVLPVQFFYISETILKFKSLFKIEKYMNIDIGFIHNSVNWKQPKGPSTSEWINKLWHIHWRACYIKWGFPGGASGKEPSCQCRRRGFDPSVRKIPWRRKWQSTPEFLPGRSHGQRSLVGYGPQGHKESDIFEQLSIHYTTTKMTKLLTHKTRLVESDIWKNI